MSSKKQRARIAQNTTVDSLLQKIEQLEASINTAINEKVIAQRDAEHWRGCIEYWEQRANRAETGERMYRRENFRLGGLVEQLRADAEKAKTVK